MRCQEALLTWSPSCPMVVVGLRVHATWHHTIRQVFMVFEFSMSYCSLDEVESELVEEVREALGVQEGEGAHHVGRQGRLGHLGGKELRTKSFMSISSMFLQEVSLTSPAARGRRRRRGVMLLHWGRIR